MRNNDKSLGAEGKGSGYRGCLIFKLSENMNTGDECLAVQMVL